MERPGLLDLLVNPVLVLELGLCGLLDLLLAGGTVGLLPDVEGALEIGGPEMGVGL